MYFIYDCNGKIVGNPKGYATMRGASRQAKIFNSKAWRDIRKARDLDLTSTTILYSIKLMRG